MATAAVGKVHLKEVPRAAMRSYRLLAVLRVRRRELARRQTTMVGVGDWTDWRAIQNDIERLYGISCYLVRRIRRTSRNH